MKKRFLLAVPFAVLVIGLAVMVGRAAAQGDGSSVIVACVRRSGAVRIVSSTGQCNSRAPNPQVREREIIWNEQHPILALFGSNVVDLSGLGGDPEIGIAETQTLTINDGTNDIFALSPIVEDPCCGFGLFDGPATTGYALGTNFLRLNVGGGGADVITLYTFDDFGFPGQLFINNKDGVFMSLRPGGIRYHGTSDASIQIPTGKFLGIDDAGPDWLFRFSDGLLDMSGSTNDPTFKLGDGAEFGFERGEFGGYVFLNENIEDGGLNKIMFRNSTDGAPANEFHFREDGVTFASPSFAFVDEETGGFTPDVVIDDNLLDVSSSDLSLQLYDCDNNVAPDIANGTFGFCVDQTSGITYMILELGGTVLRMDMSDFESFP